MQSRLSKACFASCITLSLWPPAHNTQGWSESRTPMKINDQTLVNLHKESETARQFYNLWEVISAQNCLCSGLIEIGQICVCMCVYVGLKDVRKIKFNRWHLTD